MSTMPNPLYSREETRGLAFNSATGVFGNSIRFTKMITFPKSQATSLWGKKLSLPNTPPLISYLSAMFPQPSLFLRMPVKQNVRSDYLGWNHLLLQEFHLSPSRWLDGTTRTSTSVQKRGLVIHRLSKQQHFHNICSSVPVVLLPQS